MVEAWFVIASMMLIGYVVLDGFDFGAGTLHLLIAKSDAERRQVLAAIGPYWDANEVWLLAAGGVLFLAFPRVLASAFSGFYFAIFLVLWALILRGLSLEFRSHVQDPLWRAAWDGVFAAASTALPLLLGIALGNLVRGLPIGADGWFSLSLFTSFRTREPLGILDWYTGSAGVFATLALAAHGATFLSWKTMGDVRERSRRAAIWLYAAVAIAWPLLAVLTALVTPSILAAAARQPFAVLALLVSVAGLVMVANGLWRRQELRTFLGSSAFLVGLLSAIAASSFPEMLRSRSDATRSLTVYNASAPVESLGVAARWWPLGFVLVVIYFVLLFRLHRGKAAAEDGGGH